jgi:DNA-binding GntR family transcriptional regulator
MDNDQTLVGQITRTLAERIVSGLIAPGTRLRQDHVASEFRASHVPVREAFRRLEAQGLVQSEPRRGVRVPPLDARTILEVTEMRAVLEALALSHAIPHMDGADLEMATDAITAGEASTELRIWEDANRRFHAAILRPCRMPRLLASVDDLHRASARFLFATWRELDWQPRSDQEHRGILDALEVGDADAARRRLEAHIRDAGLALVAKVGASLG